MPYRTRILTALVAAAALAALSTAAHAATSRTLFALSTGAGTKAVSSYAVATDGTLTHVADFSTGTDGPGDIALSPDGRFAYVGFDGGRTGGVDILQIADDGTVGGFTRVPFGYPVEAVSVSPDGRFLYVGDYSGSVRSFSIGADGQLTPIGATPTDASAVSDVAVSPDGRRLYASYPDDGAVATFALGADGVPSGRVDTAVGGGFGGPYGLSITAAPLRLLVQDAYGSAAAAYVLNADGSLGAATALPLGGFAGGTVASSPAGPFSFAVRDSGTSTIKSLANGATMTEASSLAFAGRIAYGGLTVSADGSDLYVRDYAANTIRRLAVSASGALSEPGPGVSVPATTYLAGAMVLRPDQPPAASFTAEPSNKTVALDASGTVDPEGDDVDRYDWDFGDGSTLPDGGPITAHDYADYGTYTVKVTATDALGCSTLRTYTGATVGCNGGSVATATRTVTVSPPFLPLPPASPAAPTTSPSEAGPTAPAPRVLPVIDGRGLGPVRAGRRGHVTLPELTAVCTSGAGPCDDSAVAVNTTIRGRTVTLGKATFARLADGATASISLRLSARGRALLAAHRSLEVQAVIRLRNAATAAQATRTVSLTLLAPRPRR